MHVLVGILSTVLIIGNVVVHCIPLFLMGLVRVLTKIAHAAALEGRLGRWMDRIVDSWIIVNRLVFRLFKLTRIEISFSGDESLSREKWYMVVSNHQSWTDILVLQTSLVDRIPMLKFFTKRQLLWVPFIGQAMWLLDFPYVRRFSREEIAANPELLDLDRKATLTACDKFRGHPTTALNFLEGTRFTTEKYQAQEEARFERLLNPKTGGLNLVLGAMDDLLDKLVDVTIDYPDGIPTIWEFMQGRCSRIVMQVDCHDLPEAIRSAPDDDSRRKATNEFVEALWREKDSRLSRKVGVEALN